ncbi:uncharacterized protein LOC143886830 isoform X2 [Tasmannia lanceolata]|uniref:uncharacterized protein LOC143886830 isoform X2 n=1 Tax=Tasmannia lanceolata TaxID=3420 RepID=UPI004062C43D
MGEEMESEVYKGEWMSEMNQWIGWSSEIPAAAKQISSDTPSVSSDSTVFTPFQLPEFDARLPVLGHEFIARNGHGHDNRYPTNGNNNRIKEENHGFNLDLYPISSDFVASGRKLRDVQPFFPAIVGEENCPSLTHKAPLLNQSNQHLFYSNNTPIWKGGPDISGFRQYSEVPLSEKSLESPILSNVTLKDSRMETANKRPRLERPAPFTTFKVRKEKLGDRITALQQLVSPFGKTDTASVLYDAIEYIKFLHDQVTVLSTPYTRLSHGREDREAAGSGLRSRGLCLVPISTTLHVAKDTTTDFWAPTFGGSYR